MTSSNQNFKKMRKVSSQILVKSTCEKFHQNWPNGLATKCCDRHTHVQTYLIPGVNIFSLEMTEYKKLTFES